MDHPGRRARLHLATRQWRDRGAGVGGEVTTAGKRLEFFFQDQSMPIARWPNEGFVKIGDVLGKTPVDVRGTKGTQEGIFTCALDLSVRKTAAPHWVLWQGTRDTATWDVGNGGILDLTGR